MAAETLTGLSGKVAVTNIGLLLSGGIDQPSLDADTLVIDDGVIVALGTAKDGGLEGARTTVDWKGTTVAPGLIDSHVHPVFGDWTPRQNQMGWIESNLNGGGTTMISAGEVQFPGPPQDVLGVK